MTHNPATSIRVHVTVHLQGPAGVPVQVDGVEATGDIAVLLNLTAVRRVWKTGTNWEPGREIVSLGTGRRGMGLVPHFKIIYFVEKLLWNLLSLCFFQLFHLIFLTHSALIKPSKCTRKKVKFTSLPPLTQPPPLCK